MGWLIAGAIFMFVLGATFGRGVYNFLVKQFKKW